MRNRKIVMLFAFLVLLLPVVFATVGVTIPEGEHICENRWDKASALALADIIKTDNSGISCQISRDSRQFDGVATENSQTYLYTECNEWEFSGNFNYYQGNPCSNRPFAYRNCKIIGEADGIVGSTGKKYQLERCVDGAETKGVRGATKQDLEDVVSGRKNVCQVFCDKQPKRYSASEFPLLTKRWWKALLIYLQG